MKTIKGAFIVLEGIDGSGKSTQIKRLADYLFTREKGRTVIMTPEPYQSNSDVDGTYFRLREKIVAPGDPQQQAQAFTDLFLKNRGVHGHWISAQVNEGHYVVCDRYKCSTIAYQHTQGMPLEELIERHQQMQWLPTPDLTIILDLPAVIAAERRAQDQVRISEELFERKLAFQETLRANYLALPRRLAGELIIVIDATPSSDEVFSKIQEEVEKVLTK